MDFERIDINQCPLGEGNKGPNHFADTARCKKKRQSVNHYKAGALGAVATSAVVSQVFGCPT